MWAPGVQGFWDWKGFGLRGLESRGVGLVLKVPGLIFGLQREGSGGPMFSPPPPPPPHITKACSEEYNAQRKGGWGV